MRREEIISGIKEAEANARSIIASARDARDAKVFEARREAERILVEAEAEARRLSDAAIRKALSDVRLECDALLHNGTNEIEVYGEKARRNMPKARELLLGSFEGSLHA